ncbi:MAG: KpsF/GutQ family sugar-phosphate isomerase [Planctomycetota bacterium]
MATSDTDLARRILHDEAAALHAAADALGESFGIAVDLIERCHAEGGTVLVSGLGKSGLIGAKIAATMSSVGVVAHAVHPTEAAHGDLGRFRTQDVAVCLSHSGETEELCSLAAALRQDGLPIIAITKNSASTLGRLAAAVLEDGVEREAATDPANGGELTAPPAPTSSTTAALALGDALCLAVAHRLRFTDADFARRHPGGQLGGLLRPITELLRFRAGENLPVVVEDRTVTDALRVASEVVRRPGALLIAAGDGTLAGIFTDSDLRRLLLKDPAALERPIAEVMTRSPRALPDSALARDAVAMIREHRQDEIPVVNAANEPVGLLDVQDLITMRLVSG